MLARASESATWRLIWRAGRPVSHIEAMSTRRASSSDTSQGAEICPDGTEPSIVHAIDRRANLCRYGSVKFSCFASSRC